MTQDTNTASAAATREIEDCPELNLSNYDLVDVDRLNDWAIRADAEIDRLRTALAAPAQPAGMTDDEKHLRRMLCVAHAGALAYMDDGEASDSRMHPTIDFLRDSPKDIQRKIWERNRAALAAAPAQPVAEPAAPHPIAPDVAADLERSDWTPEEALRWYAAGKHYDTVPNGDGSSSARILDNGAVASNALKSLSRDYAEHKGDVALMEGAAPAGVLEDAARLERERICAAIKAEDDYCVDHGDYMLDSDDCIKIVRGEWVRPDFAIDAARAQQKGQSHE